MKKPPCGSPFELPSDCGGLSVLWAAVQKAKKNPAGRGAVRVRKSPRFLGGLKGVCWQVFYQPS